MRLAPRALGHPPRPEPQPPPARVDLGAQLGERGVGQLGDDVVDEGADRRGPQRDALAPDGREEPAQAAVGEVGHLRRRDRHRLARRTHWVVARQVAQRPPRGGVGSAHAGPGRHGEQVEGRLGDPRVGADDLTAQLADESGEAHGARHLGVRPHLVRHPRALRRVDEVEVDRRLLVLVAHGGDDEPFGGSGHGDVEEAGLVVADRGLGGAEAHRPVGQHVDEVLRPEDGAAQAQVGPDPLLHARDDDDAPLATGGGLRRHEGDPAATLTTDEQRVPGHVLSQHVLEEGLGPGRGQPVDEARDGVEEGEDGVEVSVGPLPRRAAGKCRPPPRLGHPCRLPDLPQHRLRGHPRPPPPVVAHRCGTSPGAQRLRRSARRGGRPNPAAWPALAPAGGLPRGRRWPAPRPRRAPPAAAPAAAGAGRPCRSRRWARARGRRLAPGR